MIVRSGQAFIFRDIFDRFGVVSIQRRVRRYCRPHLKRRGHPFATLGVWSFLSELAGRNEVLLSDRPEDAQIDHRLVGHSSFSYPRNIGRCAAIMADRILPKIDGYRALMKAAAAPIIVLARDPRWVCGTVGVLAVLHTWTSRAACLTTDTFTSGSIKPRAALHGDRRGWVPFAIACLTASKNSAVNTTKADRQFLPSRKHVRSFCAVSDPVITPSSSNLLYPNFCKIEPPEAPWYAAQSVHQRP
jgi:hypothetical protein